MRRCLTARRPLVVRVDLNNFTFASTLQDKVSNIRLPPTALRGGHIRGDDPALA